MSSVRVGSGESRFWLASFLALLAVGAASAATINVPADHATIQAAVRAAVPGDRIRVAPGQYQESIRIDQGQTGLIIEAADPAQPPVILGFPYDSSDGFRVDDVDGVVIRNFVILDAYDGVRLNNVENAALVGLRIERNALGIRVNRGSSNLVAGCTVLDTQVEQGILVESSDGSVLFNNTVRGGSNEAIRITGSECVTALGNTVSDSYGNGIEVESSDAVIVVGSAVSSTNRNGIHVTSSNYLQMTNNVTTNNNNVGIFIDKSWPIATQADLIDAGNQSSGNAAANYVVHERRTQPDGPPACAPPPTTSTSVPSTTSTTTTRPSTTSTVPPTTTTTLAPSTSSTVPPTTTTSRPSTTSSTLATTTTTVRPTTTTTTLQPPLTPARWRFYVRYRRTSGSDLNAHVPLRSIEAPVTIAIATSQLASFPLNKRRTEEEIQALGGDTLQRLRTAVAAYLAARPTQYPGYAQLLELKWASRAP